MSNLTSTVPSAFNALYALLVTAGQAQSPKVPVYHTELVQQEPAQYLLLEKVENHRFDLAALGSYAQYETYDIVGYITYLQGNVDPPTVMTDTWALYQAVVMNTIVSNRGQPGGYVLGDSVPTVEWVLPVYANYSAQPGTFGDGAAGVAGVVEFCYSIKARITVP